MSADERPSRTLASVLAEHRRERFVGRTAERELFRSALEGCDGSSFSVLYVQGPGGIGKTSLLNAFGSIAREAGAAVAPLDGRDVDPTSASVLEALGRVLSVPDGVGPIEGPPGFSRPVLLIDSYERLAALDDWFRDRLLPRLPASAITVMAARTPPRPAWRGESAWSDLLRVVSLRNWSPQDSRAFLREQGVDEALHEQMTRATYGHPLGLALLCDVVARGGRVETAGGLPVETVQLLLRRFLGMVPDPRGRRALGACAVARCTTEPLLRDVLGERDVQDVFTWLRELSFIEPRSEGLAPHDLARDVVDADLRWRDPDTYAQVFRRVREHSLTALRATTGRAQQRAIFDLKFLFRQVRTATSPVEWDTWGEIYPEHARPGDRDAVLAMVRTWEGEESATIARRWMDLQPDGFSVIRDQAGQVRGVLAILELTRCSTEEIAADPGAQAAWDFAQRTAPPRHGEKLTICRFVVDRDSYQGPSPTLNATPILTLQQQLSTPHLSWDFLALADPDRWDEYFAAADLPRATDADFTVGARRYGLFAHDFRRVPVEAMAELWTERALAQDVQLDPRGQHPEVLVLSHADFESAVRQGFKDLGRPDLLARNPLVGTRLVADRTEETSTSGEVVLGILLREAAMTLARHPRDDKKLRAVDRTYLRPAATQESAAAGLGLPFSTYRRHLTQGMARVVSVLWDQEVYGHQRAGPSTS